MTGKMHWAWLAACALAACQPEGPPRKFQQHGVSFTYPADWEADAVEEVAPNAFSLSCEKRGFDSSGLVTVSWFQDSLDLNELQATFKEQIKTNPIYKTADVAFGAPGRGQYGRYPALLGPYRMTLLGVPHTGTVHSFYGGGKTFVVLTQQAVEDSAENRPGFQAIAQSLRADSLR